MAIKKYEIEMFVKKKVKKKTYVCGQLVTTQSRCMQFLVYTQVLVN